MSLPTDWVVGDTGHAAAHNNLDTQVNTNTTDIANKVDLDGSNFTDGGAALAAAMGLAQIKIQTAGIATLGIFLQTATPDDTTADSTDSALWFYPAGS